MNIKIDKKDDIILKILHYFITEEDYKPIIINGVANDVALTAESIGNTEVVFALITRRS